MIRQLTLLILEAIKRNGARSVFLGAIIEQIVGALIPSPLIPMSAGFLLIPKQLPLMAALISIVKKISFPYAFGATIGASFLFFIAYFGGRVLIEKFGKFLGVTLKSIDKFRTKFMGGFKDEILIFLLVVLPVTPISLVAATCGLIGVSPFEFFSLLLGGTFFRSIFLAYLGWKAGETYESIALSLNKAETILGILILGVAFGLLAFLYYKREKLLNSA